MSALAAAGVASALIGGYKVYSGEKQKSQANNLAKNNVFQQMQLPGQVPLATNLAAQNYYNGLPGASAAQAAIGNSSQNAFANASQGASSGGDLLDLGSRINQNQNVATNDLALKGAQYKAQALGGYENALNNEADWQSKLYNNNVLQPYLRTANTAASLYGAGSQNMFSGIDDIGVAGLNYANSRNAQDNGGQSNGQPKGQPITNSPYATPIIQNMTPYPTKTAPYTGWQNFSF